MYSHEAIAIFLKPISWQRAIIYFLKTFKIFQITIILDILDLPDHPDYDQIS